jgi:coenzyme PQQ precursor peptide PqqA
MLCIILHIILHTSTFALYGLRTNIMWTSPSVTEMRFGFEVTMYVMNK